MSVARRVMLAGACAAHPARAKRKPPGARTLRPGARLGNVVGSVPLFFLLQTAFSLWMLSHAVRRGAPHMWWLIILVPFGEWLYFFTVFLPDRRAGSALGQLLQRPPSLEAVERDYRQTPSHHNLVRYALVLHDAGRYADASERFSEALGRDPDDKDALYGYAATAQALGDPDAATRALEHLLELDLGYRDFRAAFDLAALHLRTERADEAIEILRQACRASQRLAPRVELARALAARERHAEARAALEEGLDTYAGSPAFVRRRDRVLAWQARRQLRSLPG